MINPTAREILDPILNALSEYACSKHCPISIEDHHTSIRVLAASTHCDYSIYYAKYWKDNTRNLVAAIDSYVPYNKADYQTNIQAALEVIPKKKDKFDGLTFIANVYSNCLPVYFDPKECKIVLPNCSVNQQRHKLVDAKNAIPTSYLNDAYLAFKKWVEKTKEPIFPCPNHSYTFVGSIITEFPDMEQKIYAIQVHDVYLKEKRILKLGGPWASPLAVEEDLSRLSKINYGYINRYAYLRYEKWVNNH